MIKNYLTIAWRNLLKHKSFSIINILGLAIGIAACMIIFLHVRHESTFDQYNTHADHIARITSVIHTPESDILLATTPGALTEVLKKDFPEVATAVRLESTVQAIKHGNEIFKEQGFYKTDPDIFSVFSFEFVAGNSSIALQQPQSLVLTQSMSKKYFGESSPLGKTLTSNGKDLLVTGVVKDRPANSDIRIDALLYGDFPKTANWEDFDPYTFVLFRQKPDLKSFEKKLLPVSSAFMDPVLNGEGSTGYSAQLKSEPLTAVHFSKDKLLDTPKGNMQSNYIFASLAIFILVIALLNYINLSTAKATERAKEVGVRKVSGAGKWQLVWQFLFESFLLVSVAWLLAIGLVAVVLPHLNELLQTQLSLTSLQHLFFMVIIFLVTLLLAGIYTAFVLSGFKPIKVLKGNWRNQTSGIWLRKTITVTQFAIAATLVTGATVIYLQMKFIREKDLGFTKDHLLNIYIPTDSIHLGKTTAFQQALRQHPAISGITMGYGMTDATLGSTYTAHEGKKRDMMATYYVIDPEFLTVFQIQLTEGRNLSDKFTTDKTEAFIVNEAFVKTMGWTSAIGKEIEGFHHKGKVVGVVKNFYYKSLHNMIEPLVMVWNLFPPNTVTVKMKPENLAVVQSLHKQYFPERAFDYVFLDDVVNKQYHRDNTMMMLFNYFTAFTVFVSCLGLYGLVALMITQRGKEISVRKILGASIQQLLLLLTKDFLKLLLWAMLIGLPVAGFLMQKWLSGYAYRVSMHWWMFLIPILLLFAVTLLVISKEVVKAALINPVKTLRSE